MKSKYSTKVWERGFRHKLSNTSGSLGSIDYYRDTGETIYREIRKATLDFSDWKWENDHEGEVSQFFVRVSEDEIHAAMKEREDIRMKIIDIMHKSEHGDCAGEPPLHCFGIADEIMKILP